MSAHGDGRHADLAYWADSCDECARILHPLRTVSYGGGVQSTAMLVLAAQNKIDFRTFIIANTGDDSEHPDTLRYVREVAKPYAEDNGIELVEVQHTRFGEPDTLLQALDRGRMIIPVRRTKDGPPMSRSCTADFKIKAVAKELKRRGATADHPATVALGISVDEIQRAKPTIDPKSPEQRRVYPLLDLGLHRRDCRDLIAAAGLPVPPKSACWFCPFHDVEAWRSLKRDTPDLFDASVALEARMSAMTSDDRPVYLTRRGVPLDEAIDDQLTLDGMGDDCDSGWCFT